MRAGLWSRSFFARHHMAIMYFKDPVLAGLLVLLHDAPHFQISTIAVFNGVLFFLYSWYMPFKDKLACWTEISNYAVFFFAASIFFTLTMPSLGMSDAIKFNYISNSIILLLIWLLLWNFGIIGFEVYKGIVSFCKWLKVKCSKKDKYVKEEIDESEVEEDLDQVVNFPKRKNYFRAAFRGFTKFLKKGTPNPPETKK
jgi:hypothetical protein